MQGTSSEEALLLGRIREGILLLSAITDTAKRMEALRCLNVGMAYLTGLSQRERRPATMDWRWV